MDTSDESFGLTDASNDSESEMEVHNNDSGHVSNGGEVYKEKLHLELSKTVKVEQEKKSKKQKRKAIEENHIDESDFQNIPIKSEPNSDFDIPKKKKRKHNDSFNKSYQEAEDYLNFRVKQEQVSVEETPPKKSKKKKKCKEEIETLENGILVPPKIEDIVEKNHLNNGSISIHDNYENFNVSKSDISHRKKKKKKKKEHSDSHDSSILESLEHNTYKEKIKNHKNKKSDIKEPCDEVQFEEELNNDDSAISTLPTVNNTIADKDDDNLNFTLKKSTETPRDKENVIQTFRISDKLRFEEDSTSNDPKETNSDAISIKLEKFLSTNSHLTPLIPNTCEDTAITENDEVWIVKGPHEICINDFENSNLSLSGKTKVKLNGKTYDSFIDDSVNTATIVSYKNKKSYVRNVSLMGVINLHRRIPRVHIPYEEVMVTDQEKFIHLPETKCRHPLFGVNYKKATKIPADVAQRLNTEEVLNDTLTKKRKLKKRKEKIEMESDIEIKQNNESIQSTSSHKKKRKRKHSGEEYLSKKIKRVKQDPDNAEAWESEQAIEKNLFNF